MWLDLCDGCSVSLVGGSATQSKAYLEGKRHQALSVQFARHVADEVVLLYEGRIDERGTPAAMQLDAPAAPQAQRFLRRLHALPGS